MNRLRYDEKVAGGRTNLIVPQSLMRVLIPLKLTLLVPALGFCFASGPLGLAGETDSRSEGILVHARELATSGQVKKAMAEIEQQLPSLNTAADKANAYEMLGDLSLDADTFSASTNALRHYERALTLAPERGGLHLKRARLLVPRADFHPQAEAALHRALELGQTNVEVFYLLGSVSKFKAEQATNSNDRLQANAAAMGFYRQALAIDSKHVPSLGNLGDIAFNSKCYPEAAQFYEAVAELEPRQEPRLVAMTRLAHTQTFLGKFDRAAILLDQAQLAYAQLPPVNDPVLNASLQIERVRVLAYKVENNLAAGRTAETRALCKKIREDIAEMKKSFTSPMLDSWDQTAKEILENQRPVEKGRSTAEL